ncbi:hemolymph lipopolysaccharide-binding protein-like [Periplaneta americana]|uniref:hemolymph lipopolysaccharide-binding protein-like n=1 Tax=Periplaneta americana TaxID=6978 RepID=UPI0037E8AECE
MVTTVRGPPNRAGPFYELIPGLGYYKFHSEVKNWYEARQICAQEGAHLLIANSPEEAKSMSVFWARHPKITNDIRNDWAHIGIHDLNQEGKWVTIFDKPLNTTGYMKWLGNEPNGGTHEDCGDINRFNGQLADVVCTLELPFICEHEL